MARKQHNHDAGYIAERTNPFVPGTKVVIYRAEEQGIDTGGNKYAIVCNAHGTLSSATNLPDARVQMKRPDNFCEYCMALESGDPAYIYGLNSEGPQETP